MAVRIRKINVSTRDTVRVVAASNLASGAEIQSIAVSSNGTLYAADFANHVVYKIYEDGRVEGVLLGELTTAGDVDSSGVGASTGLTARMDQPLGLCVDKSDNIYVGNDSGLVIRRISPSGRSRVFAGEAGSSGDTVAGLDDLATPGTDARFGANDDGMGLDVDLHGVVYMADTANNKIKKFWNSGLSTSLAGDPAGSSGFANETGEAARFDDPRDVAVDQNGTVYVADAGNHRIRKITPSGLVTTLAGNGTDSFLDGNGLVATFDTPVRLALSPSGREMFVLDKGNEAIRRVDQNGNVFTFAPYNDVASGEGDITVDNSGFIYVLENDS